VHDLLLCGVDSSMVDLRKCLARLKSASQRVYREMEALLRVVFHHWIPAHHAFLYGPDFRACIASVCLVKVRCLSLAVLIRLTRAIVLLVELARMMYITFDDFFASRHVDT
jgi:hypothetical protein